MTLHRVSGQFNDPTSRFRREMLMIYAYFLNLYEIGRNSTKLLLGKRREYDGSGGDGTSPLDHLHHV